MCRKRPFATHGQGRRPARAAVCRIPCLILCLADVEMMGRGPGRLSQMARNGCHAALARTPQASPASPRRSHSAWSGSSSRAHASIAASTPASASALRTVFDRATCPLSGATFNSSFTVLVAIFSARVHRAAILEQIGRSRWHPLLAGTFFSECVSQRLSAVGGGRGNGSSASPRALVSMMTRWWGI